MKDKIKKVYRNNKKKLRLKFKIWKQKLKILKENYSIYKFNQMKFIKKFRKQKKTELKLNVI